MRCEDSSIEKAPENPEQMKAQFPFIAYLPYLSRMSSVEPMYTQRFVESKVTSGSPGEVLRNTLLMVRGKGKNPSEKFEKLRKILQEPPFEITLQDVSFKEESDIYLYVMRDFEKSKGPGNPVDSTRDIMLEGSGFLQWLSLFAHALQEETDVLLLDEPDAHMHGDLQLKMFEKLCDICKSEGKQILMATHSTQIIERLYIQYMEDEKVHAMSVELGKVTYCDTQDEVLGLLGAIDPERRAFLINHAEVEKKHDELKKKFQESNCPVLFVEGETDEKVFNELFDFKKRDVHLQEMGGAQQAKRFYNMVKDSGRKYCFIFDKLGGDETRQKCLGLEKKVDEWKKIEHLALMLKWKDSEVTLENFFISILPECDLEKLVTKKTLKSEERRLKGGGIGRVYVFPEKGRNESDLKKRFSKDVALKLKEDKTFLKDFYRAFSYPSCPQKAWNKVLLKTRQRRGSDPLCRSIHNDIADLMLFFYLLSCPPLPACKRKVSPRLFCDVVPTRCFRAPHTRLPLLVVNECLSGSLCHLAIYHEVGMLLSNDLSLLAIVDGEGR